MEKPHPANKDLKNWQHRAATSCTMDARMDARTGRAKEINSAKRQKKVRSGPIYVMEFTESGPILHYPLVT
jgi:hypothetical protein